MGWVSGLEVDKLGNNQLEVGKALPELGIFVSEDIQLLLDVVLLATATNIRWW